MKLDIWQIGNNGMRNPYRLQKGLLAYAKYPKIGRIGNRKGVGKAEEIEFSDYLAEVGIIDADKGVNDGTHARKWRYVAQKMGFIFPKAAGNHLQEELGDLNMFTPSGLAFLNCKSLSAQYDCFLRAQMVSTEQSIYRKDFYFSPIRYGAAVLIELEKISGSSYIDQLSFDTCLQTADPTISPKVVAANIYNLMKEENAAPSKKVFKANYIKNLDYDLNHHNFQDYGNTNRRYFVITGLFEKAGKGLKIAEGKHALVELIAFPGFVESEQDPFVIQQRVCNIPSLPLDNARIALKYYAEVIALSKNYRVLPEKTIDQLSNSSAHDINIARFNLEDRILASKEDIYANKQPDQSKEIDVYLSLIQKATSTTVMCDGKEIYIPQDERPAYLEWIAWRSFLAINHMTNTSIQARHFNVDSSIFPTGTAGGGDCDVLIECGNNIFVVEVTLTTGSRQESAETESVRRHVSDIMRKNPNKNVRGVFMANLVASETYNTFKNESYIFDDDMECQPHIVPLTIAQFQTIFRYLFRDGKTYATPENFISVFERLDKNKTNFRIWREHIEREIAMLT